MQPAETALRQEIIPVTSKKPTGCFYLSIFRRSCHLKYICQLIKNIPSMLQTNIYIFPKRWSCTLSGFSVSDTSVSMWEAAVQYMFVLIINQHNHTALWKIMQSSSTYCRTWTWQRYADHHTNRHKAQQVFFFFLWQFSLEKVYIKNAFTS